jgi:hypothetical protein
MDGTEDHHVKWDKPISEDKYHIFTNMQNLDLKNNKTSL